MCGEEVGDGKEARKRETMENEHVGAEFVQGRGGREGKSQVGSRVLATPGRGKRVELDASRMVYQAVGKHVDIVLWMRQRERLWRAM